jgi:hypothetical protein
MAARAWAEAAKALNIETAERVIVALLIQAVIAVMIFAAFGAAAPASSLWLRIFTAAAPFALFPLMFAWKWVALPAALSRQITVRAANPMEMAARWKRLSDEMMAELEAHAPTMYADRYDEGDYNADPARWRQARDRNWDAMVERGNRFQASMQRRFSSRVHVALQEIAALGTVDEKKLRRHEHWETNPGCIKAAAEFIGAQAILLEQEAEARR